MGLEALRGVRKVNEIGQAFGVHPVQVNQWKKDIPGKRPVHFSSDVKENSFHSGDSSFLFPEKFFQGARKSTFFLGKNYWSTHHELS